MEKRMLFEEDGEDDDPHSSKTEKRKRFEDVSPISILDWLPQSLVLEILSKMDLELLCSVAPVCRSLRSSVSRILLSLSSLDVSGFSPSMDILNRLIKENKVLQSLTVDCSRLDDSSIKLFAKDHLQELVLLKCFNFSSHIFTVIGENCPNLRLLTLEVVLHFELESPRTCKKAIRKMLSKCLHLESLYIKFPNQYPSPSDFESSELILPSNMKVLLLQHVSNMRSTFFFPKYFQLLSLSLVLDRITDELLISITGSLHLLVDLCLEDKPFEEPSLHTDLTNTGLLSLGTCRNLKCLSLTRSKENRPSTFKRVNDFGILLLAEKCMGLEFVRLAGFSKVTDAGYASFLHSCKNLKRFEIVNAHFLSDLAFHDLADAPSSLVDVRLISCNLLTSIAAESLSSCQNLEHLDLSGCKSIADPGLQSISKLCKLTSLDLSGADITDSGLSSLGMGCSPIVSLCLRSCKRITDRGMNLLLHGGTCISRTLATLDLGHMPGISNRGITTVAEACRELTSLCIRHCFFVSDASIKALGSREGFSGERKSIRRLDLYNCCGLSINSSAHFASPFFPGLRWLGAGNTRLSCKGKEKLVEISRSRPSLSICMSGCEIGCKVGWQLHESI